MSHKPGEKAFKALESLMGKQRAATMPDSPRPKPASKKPPPPRKFGKRGK